MEGQVQRPGRQPAKGVQGAQGQVCPAGEDVHRGADGPPGAQGDHRGKVVGPDDKQAIVRRLVEQRQYSERRACKLLDLSASVYRYVPKEKNDAEVIEHMMRVAESEAQWGFSCSLRPWK